MRHSFLVFLLLAVGAQCFLSKLHKDIDIELNIKSGGSILAAEIGLTTAVLKLVNENSTTNFSTAAPSTRPAQEPTIHVRPLSDLFTIQSWIIRGESALRVVEQYTAFPVKGKMWRDILFECGLKNVTLYLDGVQSKHVHWELLPTGFVRIFLASGRTSAASVRLEYTLIDSILPVRKNLEFAVVLGLPPCSESICPHLSRVQADVIIPGNVTMAKGHLHVPVTMFKHLPLSGVPHTPPPLMSRHVHADEKGNVITRLEFSAPPQNDVIRDSEPLHTTAVGEPPDGIAFFARFEVVEPDFHVGTDNCFPLEFVSDLIASDVSSSKGANLMLELGSAIVIICAGIPCLCGIGCWAWVRFVQKKKAPKTPRSGIASFSYGSGSHSFYDIVNEDNEQTIATHMQSDPSYAPKVSAREASRFV